MRGYAWITLATNDPYCLGALVLAHSLKCVGTKHDLAILITPGVTMTMREKLKAVFSVVEEVNVLDSQDEANLALLARPELGITFTKLHCWKLTQYEKCVFVDADALVVRNCDELFEREELSAAPDVGWPDCFNSGVFVFKPSQQTFEQLTAFAESKGSFDGGDQGLLNQYFSDWAHKDISKHLPFIYNMCSTATYSYLPAYKQYGENVKIIHFIGSTKPWLQYFDTETGQVHPSSESGHLQSLLQHWWNIFCEMVHPQLSPDMARSTLAPIWHDSYPRVSTPAFTLSNHQIHNSTDVTYDEVDIPIPDFSEFHDPWDNYIEVAKKVNNNHVRIEYVDGTDSIKDKENQCQSNNDTTDRPRKINDWGDGKHNNYDYCNGFESTCSQERVEHSENVQSSFETIENDELTKLHGQENNLDEYSNLEHRSDNHEYITHQHHQYDNSSNDTQYIRSPDNHYDEHSESLIQGENDRDCQNNIEYTDTHTINSQTHSQTCSEPKSIACQSETVSFGDLAHDNTGIAGALAKMTLGTTRSREQEALEEHMRKQSWEQGKIDYMGRDCFDNIWTKICTTISTATESDSRPSHEGTTINDGQSQNQSTMTQAAVPTLQQHEALEMSNKSVPSELLSATIATAQNPPDIVQKRPEPVLALTCSTPQLCIEGSSKKYRDVETNVPSATAPTQEAECIRLPTVIPLPFSSELTLESITSAAIQVNESSPEESLLTDESQKTRGVDNTSGPIQVAESVLEADIKESVSEDLKPVSEEAISSVSAPIQESISTVVETPLEPPAPAHCPPVEALLPTQPNGTNEMDSNTEANENFGRRVPPISSTAPPVLQETLASAEPRSVPASAPKPEFKEVLELKTQINETEDIVSEIKRTPESESTSYNPATVNEATESKASSSQSSTDIHQKSESSSVVAPIEDTVIRDVQSDTKTEKPASTIQLKIPGTPIITAATPPTSPPLDAVASPEEKMKTTKKVVKKVIKKSSPDEKTEGSETEENKKSKKIISKKGSTCATKKAKESKEALEEGDCSSAVGKPKKIIKVKKATKSADSLESNTSVPDTPPPTTSETPIPPKRKLKSATAKSSTNKPDSEP